MSVRGMSKVWTDGQTDGWIDGWMGGWIQFSTSKLHLKSGILAHINISDKSWSSSHVATEQILSACFLWLM